MKYLQNLSEFNEAIASEKLVVVDFTATWCGPCKMLAPKYEVLAEKYQDDVVCYKVDVDEAADISRECNISSMPTIKYYKNGEELFTFSGANVKKLEENIIKFM